MTAKHKGKHESGEKRARDRRTREEEEVDAFLHNRNRPLCTLHGTINDAMADLLLWNGHVQSSSPRGDAVRD